MKTWAWIRDYIDELERNPDPRKEAMVDSFRATLNAMEEDPAQALRLARELKRAAEHLGESWWVVLANRYILLLQMYHLFDYHSVLDEAVQAALHARRPECVGCPQRVCVHDALVSAYINIDAGGYADAIDQALDYMQREVDPDVKCRLCLQGHRADFHFDRGRLSDAERETQEYIRLTDAMAPGSVDSSDVALGWCRLAEVWLRTGEWDRLDALARQGEELARRTQANNYLARFLVFRSAVAQARGEVEESRDLLRQARTRVARLGSPPGTYFFDDVVIVQEMAGDLAGALKTRERSLELFGGKRQWWIEFGMRRDHCRLLAKMGLPTETAAATAREVASHLQNSAAHLAEIDRVLVGG